MDFLWPTNVTKRYQLGEGELVREFQIRFFIERVFPRFTLLSKDGLIESLNRVV